MSLGAIVFPVIIGIGVIRYLTTPANQRSDDSKKYFQKFLIGVFLVWIGIETKGDMPVFVSVVIALGGFYLSLFNGIYLFSEDSKTK